MQLKYFKSRLSFKENCLVYIIYSQQKCSFIRSRIITFHNSVSVEYLVFFLRVFRPNILIITLLYTNYNKVKVIKKKWAAKNNRTKFKLVSCIRTTIYVREKRH